MTTTPASDLAPSAADEPALLDWLRRMRDDQPVWRDGTGIWHVFRHADVETVIRDPATFSSNSGRIFPAARPVQRGMLTAIDPPEHRSLRRLVSAAFTPRTVAGLEPRIRQVTRELLDPAGERFDLVDTLAFPLPVIVIAELLGIPSTDRPTFRRWADTLFDQANIDPEDSLQKVGEEAVASVAPTIREMNTYLLDYIRSRRANPGQDLTSKLLQAEVDGERLDDQEIIGFVGLLLLAGHITTTATLGNTIVSFEESPNAAKEIRADPSPLPAAIEEVLRYRTPFPRLARIATTNAQVGDVEIPAQGVILVWLTAANRDARVFPDPNRFDIHRKPNPHLTFGHGIHFCLGAPLARLEAKVALRIMLDRYRGITVATDAPVEYRNPWLMVSVNKLPLDVRAA